MLFNIFINDLFLLDLESEICNFADNNTIFTRGNDLEEVIVKLEDDLRNGFQKNSSLCS